MKKHPFLAVCAAVLLVTACGAPPAAPQSAPGKTPAPFTPTPTPEPATIAMNTPAATPTLPPSPAADQGAKPVARGDVTPELVAANTRFGFKLLGELLKTEGARNVFISPASVAIALAMTYNGAQGETMKAMAQSLDLLDLSLGEVNQAYAALKQTLENADPDVKLSIANSLWARQGVDFLPDFIQRVTLNYGAQVTALDFGDPAARDTINAWVSQATSGRIPTIVDQISPDSVLFLINAIYFKSAWVKAFDAKLTQERPFHLLDGSQKSMPMMMQSGEFEYLKGDRFQAVSLPYGREDQSARYSMVVFLPDEGTSLADFETTLTAGNWTSWMSGLATADGTLVLPRFQLSYEVAMKDALTALGMGPAFDPGTADFGGLRPAPPVIFISQVKHKSFVEVNEEGTEAAAATSVEIGTTSARPMPDRFSMIVDRPFFFAIRDRQSGAILFLGSIVAP